MIRGRIREIGKAKDVFIDVHKTSLVKMSWLLSVLHKFKLHKRLPFLMRTLFKDCVTYGPEIDLIVSNVPSHYSVVIVSIDGDWVDSIALDQLDRKGYRTKILTKKQADKFLNTDSVEFIVTNRKQFRDTHLGYLLPEDIYG